MLAKIRKITIENYKVTDSNVKLPEPETNASPVWKCIMSFDEFHNPDYEEVRGELYEECLIVWTKRRFAIIDMKTKEKLLCYDDIKSEPVISPCSKNTSSYPNYIKALKLHKDFIVICWSFNNDIGLQKINLSDMSAGNIVMTADSFSAEQNKPCICKEKISLDVNDNTIFLTAGVTSDDRIFGSSDGRYIIHEKYNFDTLEKISSTYTKLDYNHKHICYCTVYKGYLYRYLDRNMRICSDNPAYDFNGFYNETRRGSIGLFKINEEKIYATAAYKLTDNYINHNSFWYQRMIFSGDYSDFSPVTDSIPKDGEICIFDLHGGKPIHTIQTGLPRISGFVIESNLLIVWNEKKNIIKFYHKHKFELICSIDISEFTGGLSPTGIKEIEDVRYDCKTGRLIVSKYGTIYVIGIQ